MITQRRKLNTENTTNIMRMCKKFRKRKLKFGDYFGTKAFLIILQLHKNCKKYI